METAAATEIRADAPFGALARVAPVGIVQSDADGRAVFVNERWCALSGLTAAQAIGTRWLDLLLPADRAGIERMMTAQRRPEVGRPEAGRPEAGRPEAGRPEVGRSELGPPEIAFDARLRTAAGAQVQVRGSVVALRRGGQPAGTLATFAVVPVVPVVPAEPGEPAPAGPRGRPAPAYPPADPTAQFVAIVSHELRTPLTSIISFLELIRAEDDGLSPDGRRFLDIIQRNANRLLRLVGDLLLLSRIESGIISPAELLPVSIPELACEAVRNAAPAAAGFGVTLEGETGDGPQMPGDHLGLTQLLDNLIANAVKFSHPGDTVRVRAGWAGGQWRIDVADQGIGIPPDEIGQLFHRFVRASNARTSGRPGTGLGLSVVKAIVELHGGTITVDSMLEQGTTFSIFLPTPAVRPA